MASLFIDELRFSPGAEDELACHHVDSQDVLEVSWDDPAFYRDKEPGRHLMIGRTAGGRLLTIVVQERRETGVWDVVTGWESDKGERTQWSKARPRSIPK